MEAILPRMATPHFIKCLENTKLTPFPRELKISRAERPPRVVVDIL
jgi:hypothetical protein